MQLQLDTKKTCIVAFLALFAFSSLGFAVLGLILGPDYRGGLDRRHELEVQILRPQVPDLDSLVEFWGEAGFNLFQRTQENELQPAGDGTSMLPGYKPAKSGCSCPKALGSI